MSKKMSPSGCRLRRGRAQQRECKKGGLIAFQPSQSETQCLSASMTEQPFLHLIPFSIKKSLECQAKCCFLASEPRIIRITRIAQIAVFLCWRGIHRFFGFLWVCTQKVVDIHRSSWYKRSRWQGRAAFFQSATSCRWECPPSGALTCESCRCPHWRAGAAMGEHFVAPTVVNIHRMEPLASPYPRGLAHEGQVRLCLRLLARYMLRLLKDCHDLPPLSEL